MRSSHIILDASTGMLQKQLQVVMVTGDHPATARAIAKCVSILGEDEEDDGKKSESFKACAACWPFIFK